MLTTTHISGGLSREMEDEYIDEHIDGSTVCKYNLDENINCTWFAPPKA